MTTQEDSDHNPAAILAKRSQVAKAQLPRHSASLRAFAPIFDGLWTRVYALKARLLGMREERAQDAVSVAKRIHHRASGIFCKAGL